MQYKTDGRRHAVCSGRKIISIFGFRFLNLKSQIVNRKSQIILLLTAYCLLLTAFAGCAGGQLTKKDIKSLPWQTHLFNKERQGRTEDTVMPPPALLTSHKIAGAAIFN